jgi:hypothetical protein
MFGNRNSVEVNSVGVERLEIARAVYDRAKAALGKLRVEIFTGLADPHVARRQKADLEDELERAGRALQDAMLAGVNLPQ